MAPAAADVGRTIYQWATGFPPVHWSITGRWFLMVLSGQPYVPGIGKAPSLPHELLAGHAAYYTISLIFAAAYVIGLRVAGRRPSLLNGLAFGWATLVFPFLVQMPLMGFGARWCTIRASGWGWRWVRCWRTGFSGAGATDGRFTLFVRHYEVLRIFFLDFYS